MLLREHSPIQSQRAICDLACSQKSILLVLFPALLGFFPHVQHIKRAVMTAVDRILSRIFSLGDKILNTMVGGGLQS